MLPPSFIELNIVYFTHGLKDSYWAIGLDFLPVPEGANSDRRHCWNVVSVNLEYLVS